MEKVEELEWLEKFSNEMQGEACRLRNKGLTDYSGGILYVVAHLNARLMDIPRSGGPEWGRRTPVEAQNEELRAMLTRAEHKLRPHMPCKEQCTDPLGYCEADGDCLEAK